MSTVTLQDKQWQKIYEFLQEHSRAYAGEEEKCRLFVEAVLLIHHSGAQWLKSMANGIASVAGVLKGCRIIRPKAGGCGLCGWVYAVLYVDWCFGGDVGVLRLLAGR